MTYRFSALPLVAEIAQRFPGRSPQRVLHVSGSTWAHFRRHGLSAFQADRLACRIGLHPAVLWPEWYATEDEEVAV